ncbi:RNA-directed DNA polymerase, eukaryota, reverse transcriptase zinc-binding domain protein, partial [Tanacetum coccineum]
EESMPVYDIDIEDVIEEKEGFVGKGGFGGEEDYIKDVVVVANDLCSSMIQTTLSVNFKEDINTKSHELMSFGKGDASRKSMNFCTLITSTRNGADVVVTLESIQGLANGLLNRLMFSSKDGLDAMLENGPWFIRINPLILKKWDPDVNLLKEDVSNVLVWVKLHSVPMMVFSEDGLSAIATKLGTPLMIDSCSSCKVFGHVLNERPKKIVPNVVKNLNNSRQAVRGVPVGPKWKKEASSGTNGGISKSAMMGSDVLSVPDRVEFRAFEIDGYAVLSEVNTTWIRRMKDLGYAVLGIKNVHFLVKSRR